MYVWVLLATFIAMLYAFNLSTREDMRSLYTVPQAESVVAKIVTQHRAARQYMITGQQRFPTIPAKLRLMTCSIICRTVLNVTANIRR